LIEIKAGDAEARQAIAMTRRANPARIVVVEDDAPLLGALAFALEAEGWEASTFASPAEALAGVGSAACLLIDYNLPQMDGLTLISRLREQGVDAPAILITARPDERCRRRARAAGVAIVEKPLAPGRLEQQIKAELQRPKT
jgi:two-component system, LuxR family, response regulator FixJ